MRATAADISAASNVVKQASTLATAAVITARQGSSPKSALRRSNIVCGKTICASTSESRRW
jgi:hypothetical protein